jgi:aryl-alcohol dehydrogenase-like predicted oxidoreductase
VALRGISLGCGNFGGVGSAPEFFGQGIPEDDAFAIMNRAWGAGIRWFDTGDAYGGGASEEWIGRWRADRKPVDLVLTTKVFHSTSGTPGDVGLAPDRIRRQLESSLTRLGVDSVDLYLAHDRDTVTRLADTIATFVRLRDEGLIGAWGLSNYDASGLREALERDRPALVQNSFSLLDRGDEEEVLPLCEQHGIAYVPFGPLAGGWLTGKYRRDEPFPEGSRMTQRPASYERYVDDGVFDALDRLDAEAKGRGVDMATLAFAWVLARVDGAVCGPMRAEHLEPVLAARELVLSPEDVERIGQAVSTNASTASAKPSISASPSGSESAMKPRRP